MLGYQSSARRRPLPSRSSSSLSSLAATPLGLSGTGATTMLGRASVPWICRSQRVRVSFQKSEQSRLFRLPTSVPSPPLEPLCFCPRGMGSQWKQGPRARLGNHPPGRRHPSLAATSCPTPSRMYTDWISLVLRQRSQAQTAEASVVSSPYALSVMPVHSRWNHFWQEASHRMASWSSFTSLRQAPHGYTRPGGG